MSDKEGEKQIISENMEALIDNLKPGDDKFIGFDQEFEYYHIGKYRFKTIKPNLYIKKQMREELAPHDNIIKQMNDLDPIKDVAKYNTLLSKQDEVQEQLVEKIVPELLSEPDGKPFDKTKWFGKDSPIPYGPWWDVVRDMYLFLRVGGSRDEMLRSLMQSKTKS